MLITHSNICDIEELNVYQYRNGIKLLNPKEVKNSIFPQKFLKLTNLFTSQLSIYFLDVESKLKTCNSINLELIQANSLKDAYNRSAFDFFPIEECKIIAGNDQQVMRLDKNIFFDEQVSAKDDSFIEGVSLKLPWYDADNHVIGIVGFTAILNKYSPAQAFSLFAELGFSRQGSAISKCFPGLQLHNAYLSKRENEILRYTIRGKSSRLISEILNISNRTVQTHLENIKNKLGVTNKAELIEKTFDLIDFRGY